METWKEIVEILAQRGYVGFDGNFLKDDPLFKKIEVLAEKADKAIEYVDKLDAIRVADKLAGSK